MHHHANPSVTKVIVLTREDDYGVRDNPAPGPSVRRTSTGNSPRGPAPGGTANRPSGTRSDAQAGPPGGIDRWPDLADSDPGVWGGNYVMGQGQRVSGGGASAPAGALERALPDVPGHDARVRAARGARRARGRAAATVIARSGPRPGRP
jgi:hypothetical protein